MYSSGDEKEPGTCSLGITIFDAEAKPYGSRAGLAPSKGVTGLTVNGVRAEPSGDNPGLERGEPGNGRSERGEPGKGRAVPCGGLPGSRSKARPGLKGAPTALPAKVGFTGEPRAEVVKGRTRLGDNGVVGNEISSPVERRSGDVVPKLSCEKKGGGLIGLPDADNGRGRGGLPRGDAAPTRCNGVRLGSGNALP